MEETNNRIREVSAVSMADFAYNQDNPKYNGNGEPPSMIYEMAEKQWKLWHIKSFIDELLKSQRDELVEKILNAPIPNEWEEQSIDEAKDYFITLIKEEK